MHRARRSSANKRSEPEAEDAEPGPGLGERLKSAREAQRLSLEDLAAELRIGAESLRALEEERYEALGAPVFAKGYLKHYGARLGLDVAELVAAYGRSPASARIEVAPTRSIRLRDERQITVWIVAGLALALIVVFLVVWWLGLPETLFS
jgi:cytoskeleton protein RodZ